MEAQNLTDPGTTSTIKGKLFPKPRIRISQYQGTDILQIKAVSPEPVEAMMMANILAEIMVEQNQTQMRAEYRSARIFLEDEMHKIKGRYHEALLKFTEFQKEEYTLNLRAETRLAIDKMADLMKEKEDNIIDLAEAHAKLNRLKQELAKLSPEYVSGLSLKESPQIKILKERLTELRLQLTQAASELTESHPEIQSLREQIRTAEAELKSELDVYRSSAPELTALQRQIAALDSHLKGVNANIDKYLKAWHGLPDKALQQANLDMEIRVAQQAYSSLLDSLYQIGIAEASTLSEIRVVEPAVKPLFPASPNVALNSVLGLFLGLVFGLGLALVIESVDDTIRTGEDVKKLKFAALIGAVPKQEKMPLISSRDPNDPLYEAYRRIETHINIFDHMRERPLKNLLITSGVPQEGKSTTVANLAICMCRKGKKVAIVDMDLRRPTLHTYFDVPNDLGITNLLNGESVKDDVIIKPTQIQGLSVIPSGPPLPDPATLIESDRVGLLMSKLRDRFDMVIMDSAPLLVKSDALVLAERADGVIIVLESGKTTRHAVHELMEILGRANIEPLGFILNRFSMGRGKYYYQQYYYGHYGSELSPGKSSS